MFRAGRSGDVLAEAAPDRESALLGGLAYPVGSLRFSRCLSGTRRQGGRIPPEPVAAEWAFRIVEQDGTGSPPPLNLVA